MRALVIPVVRLPAPSTVTATSVLLPVGFHPPYAIGLLSQYADPLVPVGLDSCFGGRTGKLGRCRVFGCIGRWLGRFGGGGRLSGLSQDRNGSAMRFDGAGSAAARRISAVGRSRHRAGQAAQHHENDDSVGHRPNPFAKVIEPQLSAHAMAGRVVAHFSRSVASAPLRGLEWPRSVSGMCRSSGPPLTGHRGDKSPSQRDAEEVRADRCF